MDFITPMISMGALITLVAALPFLLIAVFLWIVALRARRKTQASQGWMETRGKVLASHVEQRSHPRPGGGGHMTTLYPVVLYEYKVGLQQYQSNRLALGPEVGGSLIAQKRIGKYPIHSPVTVYYNPADPSEAVLERHAPANKWLLIVAGILVGMLAVTILFMGALFYFLAYFV